MRSGNKTTVFLVTLFTPRMTAEINSGLRHHSYGSATLNQEQ
jgi:hypothetical protein